MTSPRCVHSNHFAYCSCRGYEIAALAAGGSIALVDAALDGTIDNGYALVRYWPVQWTDWQQSIVAANICCYSETITSHCRLSARHCDVLTSGAVDQS